MTTSGSGGRGAGRDPARGALAPVSHSPPSVTEVVLSFDTTGSMYPYLKEVRERLLDIVKRLQAEAARHKETIRVAIIAHGDYCDKDTTYVEKFLPLHDLADAGTIGRLTKFITEVGQTGGGDGPECYELALHRARGMDWTDRSKRILVIIGDNDPHEPGYKCGSYTNTLDWRKALDALVKRQVRIYAVEADGSKRAFWQQLADKTDGRRLGIKDMKTLPDLVVAAVLKEVSDASFEAYGEELRTRGAMRDEVRVVYELIRTVRVVRTHGAPSRAGGLAMASLDMDDMTRHMGMLTAGPSRAHAEPHFKAHAEPHFKAHAEPCTHFFKTGYCRYGDKCKFAH